MLNLPEKQVPQPGRTPTPTLDTGPFLSSVLVGFCSEAAAASPSLRACSGGSEKLNVHLPEPQQVKEGESLGPLWLSSPFFAPPLLQKWPKSYQWWSFQNFLEKGTFS